VTIRILPNFPVGTLANADFISGRSVLADGERVIDCCRNLEDMAPSGWLCIKEQTLVEIMETLGYELERKSEQLVDG
jgi:hypothetical protein